MLRFMSNLLLRFPQPHPRPLAVLVNEDDVCSFEDGLEAGGPGRTRTCNQTVMSGRL